MFVFFVESLAYVMAATHGLDEQAEQLKESLDDKVKKSMKRRKKMKKKKKKIFSSFRFVQVPEVNENAELILPPCPISQQESNWPLLAVSRGVFEGSIIKGNQNVGGPAATTSNFVPTGRTTFAAADQIDDVRTSGGDWADDDVQMEDDEDGIREREAIDGNGDEQGGGWEGAEIEIPADLVNKNLNEE